MDRRSLIKHMSAAGSLTLLPPTIFLGCKSDSYQLEFLTESQYELLDEMSEIILPETESSPGAKSAKVAHFLDSYVFHCLSPEKQKQFQEDVDSLVSSCRSKFEKAIPALTSDQQSSFMSSLENEKSTPYLNSKQLILFGYFTSEVGMTEALRYVGLPGRFDGDIKYNDGDKAWAV